MLHVKIVSKAHLFINNILLSLQMSCQYNKNHETSNKNQYSN